MEVLFSHLDCKVCFFLNKLRNLVVDSLHFALVILLYIYLGLILLQEPVGLLGGRFAFLPKAFALIGEVYYLGVDILHLVASLGIVRGEVSWSLRAILDYIGRLLGQRWGRIECANKGKRYYKKLFFTHNLFVVLFFLFEASIFVYWFY